MKKFRRHLERKRMTLNIEKSKIMTFGKGGGKRKNRRVWKWGEEKIEKVRELKYLGWVLQTNEKAEKHILDRMR